MIDTTLLGPAGVLPPGEWAVGARVRFGLVSGNRRGVISEWPHVSDGPSTAVWLASFGGAGEGGAYHDPVDIAVYQVRLDLSRGPLDFGTRALLSLVAPEVEQPLTAPGWASERWADGRGGHVWIWFLLIGEGPARCAVWESKPMPEPNPRRALCMALAHAEKGRLP